MKSLILLMLIPGLSVAGELAHYNDPELCIGLATTLLTGEQQAMGSMDMIVKEIKERDLVCPDSYLTIAEMRLNQKRYQADHEAQLAAQEAAYDSQRRADRSRALLNLSNQLLNQPYAAPPAPMAPIAPTTTKCRWVGQNYICNSW